MHAVMRVPSLQASTPSNESLEARLARIEAANAELVAQLAKVTAERDHLRASYERLRLDLELLKKRIYVAQAERVNTQQLELEFASKLAILNKLDEQLAAQLAAEDAAAENDGARGGKKTVVSPRSQDTGAGGNGFG